MTITLWLSLPVTRRRTGKIQRHASHDVVAEAEIAADADRYKNDVNHGHSNDHDGNVLLRFFHFVFNRQYLWEGREGR